MPAPAVDDIRVSQAVQPDPPAYDDQIFSPIASGLWGFDASKKPFAVQLGANLAMVGNVLNGSAGGITSVNWGGIIGTLSAQTDLQAALDAKEPTVAAGTTGQYWRGDKRRQTLNSAAVGLGNVENTALSTWAGSTNLTTLGTIATGTWHGAAVADAYIASAATWNAKEPGITGGTTSQYWRGDKTFQTLDKTAVGLSNVENTALSTWAGSTNLTTLGTITTGVWHGTAVGDTWISSAATWNAKQTGSASLTSLAALTYVSTSFVKMTAANTFALDTNTYLTSGTGVSSITGTANEITASASVGAVTLSLPSALTFTGKTVTGGTFNVGAVTCTTLSTSGLSIFNTGGGLVRTPDANCIMQILGATGGSAPHVVLESEDSGGQFILRRANFGTTAILSGDNMGFFSWAGHDGSAFTAGRARLQATASENWTTSANGCYYEFFATANGSTSPTSCGTVTATGMNAMAIGTTTPSTGAFTTLTVTDTTDSTSTITGAVTIAGGLGVAKQLYALGMHATDTTDATSISTGTIITAGGLGVAKAAYFGLGQGGTRARIVLSVNGTGTNASCLNLSRDTGSAMTQFIDGAGKVTADALTLWSSGGSHTPGYEMFNGVWSWYIDYITTPIELMRLQATSLADAKLTLFGTTDSSSTITGAVTIAGGLGVAKQIYALGMHATDTTDATSISTGTIITAGGLGVAKGAYFGGQIRSLVSASGAMGGSLYLSNEAAVAVGNTSTMFFSTLTGDVNTWQIVARQNSTTVTDKTLRFILGGVAQHTYFNSGDLSTQAGILLKVLDTTDSTSTATGSIVTAGGLGVAKAGWFGSNLNISGAGGANVAFWMVNTNSAADQKSWSFSVDNNGKLSLVAANDSRVGSNNLFTVARTGATIGTFTFGSQVPVAIDSGSVSTPAIQLGGDTTTGLYRIGANNVGFSVSGTKVFEWTSTGINSAAIGATTPSTGAFTTLSASTSITSTGVINVNDANGTIRQNANDTSLLTLIGGTGSAARLQLYGGAGGIAKGFVLDADTQLFRTQAGTLVLTIAAAGIRVAGAGGYISSDGSAGYTGTVTSASLVGKTITIKDGIITAFA